MKQIYYDSQKRFENRIIKSWIKSGFKFNSGHVQLLRFAWIAKRFWANRNEIKVSKVNIVEAKTLRLF